VSTLPRKRWAQRAQELEFEQLDGVRARAEQWRNGLTGLTALLATVTIIKGPDTAANLSDATRTDVVNQLTWAFLLLLLGSLLAMLAAFGWPSGEMLLTGERLAAWERDETRRARRIFRAAALCLVVGVLLVGVSTRSVLLEEPKREHHVVVDTGGSRLVCGVLQRGDGGVLTLTVADPLGDQIERTIRFRDIVRLRTVEECPSPR
jgi:hypothetical protein